MPTPLIMSKYLGQTALGLMGLICVASPLILKLPSQFKSFDAATQIESNEYVERSHILQRRETANTLAKAGVLPNGQKLKIRKYFDDPNNDPKPDTTGWLADETVYVYDAGGICIGKIQNRKWLWIHNYESACNNAPAM